MSCCRELPKKIMLFKTNYRDLGEARKNAKILENLIRKLIYPKNGKINLTYIRKAYSRYE